MATVEFKSFKSITETLEKYGAQLEQLRDLQEKQTTELSNLNASFSSVQTQLKDALEQLARISQSFNKLTVNPTQATTIRRESKIIHGGDSHSEPSSENQQTKMFFAKAYNENDRQIIELKNTSNASNTMPFKVKASGDKGTIVFNVDSYAEIAKNLQVLVFPFCQVNMKVGVTPKGVENVESGEVVFRNNVWVITKKPQIKII